MRCFSRVSTKAGSGKSSYCAARIRLRIVTTAGSRSAANAARCPGESPRISAVQYRLTRLGPERSGRRMATSHQTSEHGKTAAQLDQEPPVGGADCAGPFAEHDRDFGIGQSGQQQVEEGSLFLGQAALARPSKLGGVFVTDRPVLGTALRISWIEVAIQ